MFCAEQFTHVETFKYIATITIGMLSGFEGVDVSIQKQWIKRGLDK